MDITRLDKSLPLPAYQTKGAVGIDLYSRVDVLITPRGVTRIPSNIIAKVPEGYMILLRDRSSLAKKGMIVTAGVIDQDYCGPEDEILIQVINFTDEYVRVKRGERLVNAIVIPIEKFDLNEVDFSGESRGGFGTTGDK